MDGVIEEWKNYSEYAGVWAIESRLILKIPNDMDSLISGDWPN